MKTLGGAHLFCVGMYYVFHNSGSWIRVEIIFYSSLFPLLLLVFFVSLLESFATFSIPLLAVASN